MPKMVHRLSMKDFDDTRSIADSGIGSSVAGSMSSESSILSHVRTKITLMPCSV